MFQISLENYSFDYAIGTSNPRSKLWVIILDSCTRSKFRDNSGLMCNMPHMQTPFCMKRRMHIVNLGP